NINFLESKIGRLRLVVYYPLGGNTLFFYLKLFSVLFTTSNSRSKPLFNMTTFSHSYLPLNIFKYSKSIHLKRITYIFYFTSSRILLCIFDEIISYHVKSVSDIFF